MTADKIPDVFTKEKYLDAKSLIWAIIFLVVNPFILLSQDKALKFEQLTLEHGLSQVSVKSILKDHRGFMWFGTQGGLNKYDGYKFTIYSNDPSDSTSIISNQIECVFEDNDKDLWIGTRSGLDRFDRDTESFVHYNLAHSKAENSLDYSVFSVDNGEKGFLWLGTSRGLIKLNKETRRITSYKSISGDSTSITDERINAIVADKNGNIWVGTETGLEHLDVRTNQFSRFSDPPSKASLWIKYLALDKQGRLWMGTQTGLDCFDTKSKKFIGKTFRQINKTTLVRAFSLTIDDQGKVYYGDRAGLNIFDPDTQTLVHYEHDEKDPFSLKENQVTCIYIDDLSTLWIGTHSNGINKLLTRYRQFNTYHHNPSQNSISDNHIWHISEDKEGTLMLGTNMGLNFFNPRTRQWSLLLLNKENKSKNIVWSMHEDKEGNLWIGSYGEGLLKYDKERKTFKKYSDPSDGPIGHNNRYVWKIVEDKESFLWFGSEGSLKKFDPKTGNFTSFKHNPDDPSSISSDAIWPVFFDAAGTLWIGTDGGGLNSFNSKTGKFTHYKYDPKNPKSISNNYVWSIYEDKKGTLWIGTFGGLNKFDKKTSTFKSYRERDGLPNDIIYGILEDNKGNLWLSTNKGLSKFNPTTETFKNYDSNDGLKSDEFTAGSYYKTRSGEFYLGGINGLNSFHPDSITDNLNIPTVVITDLSIFNKKASIGKESPLKKSITESDSLVLSYKESFLTFEFAALNYDNPKKNQYAYKLEGFDKDWYYIGNSRTATYTNLEPGNYKLRVKASNHHGVWNEQGKTLVLIINPPFWKTIWFKILSALTVIGAFVLFYKVRVNIIKKQKEDLEKQVIARTIDLTKANNEVRDSIRAAQTIQQSILPSENFIKKYLPQTFILNMPKDLVSGDFYWFDAIDGKIIFACVDCTGHGVSGAFMSILGHTLLNQSIHSIENTTAAQILDRLHRGIISELHAKNEHSEIQDGMDVALCVIDIAHKTIQFAGASSPLYLLRNKELIQVKGNKFPIGLTSKTDIKFSNKEMDLQQGDIIYLFSDGYADQLGGEQGDKFQYYRFRELLVEIGDKDMNLQRELLHRKFLEWQGDNEQLDDVMVIGFKPLG